MEEFSLPRAGSSCERRKLQTFDAAFRSCDVKANQRRRIGAKLLSSATTFCVSAGIPDASVAFKVSLDEELRAGVLPLPWRVSTPPTGGRRQRLLLLADASAAPGTCQAV